MLYAILTSKKIEKQGSRLLLFLLAATGGILWIGSGVVLAMAPAGNPPHSFRVPAVDVRFPLAFGLLLVSTSLGFSLLSVTGARSRAFRIIHLLIFLSGGLHFCGRLVRDAFLQKTGWEPLLPLGFLLFIGSLFTMGVLTIRKKADAPVTGLLMILTALLLLFFNDQYLPFMAIPFGLAVIVLSAFLNLWRR